MIELLREPQQSARVLALFFFCILIYVFLHLNDARRLRYFFRSFYNKQYHVNYGRQSSWSHHFVLLLSLQSILLASFLLHQYLSFCSEYVNFSMQLPFSIVVIALFLILKWGAVFGVSVLFNKQKLFKDFLTLSAQFANLAFCPVLLLSIYFYLNKGLNPNSISNLVSVSLLFLWVGKLRVFTYMRKEAPLSLYYFILYLCTFEITPILWLLIGLDC